MYKSVLRGFGLLTSLLLAFDFRRIPGMLTVTNPLTDFSEQVQVALHCVYYFFPQQLIGYLKLLFLIGATLLLLVLHCSPTV